MVPSSQSAALRLWVQCDDCQKWRRQPLFIESPVLPETWTCSMNEYDRRRNTCEAPQEKMGAEPELESPAPPESEDGFLSFSNPSNWDSLVMEKVKKSMGFPSDEVASMSIKSSVEAAESGKVVEAGPSGGATDGHHSDAHGASVHHNENVAPGEKPSGGASMLMFCFFGIMFSFVMYALVMEGTTKDAHISEISLIFVTSLTYTLTAAVGKRVNREPEATIPRHKMMMVALLSLTSSWLSIRSLRYVIFPIQVLAKSCKPIPVMIIGVALGKRYRLRKYLSVLLIVGGVAVFMLADLHGKSHKHKEDEGEGSHAGGEEEEGGGGGGAGGESEVQRKAAEAAFGLFMLTVSLFCDGGTGALEDRFMREGDVGAFDLMFHIQLGKTLVSGVALVMLGQVGMLAEMVRQIGANVLLLCLTGAMGQAFIFITISRFGALTCAIIGLCRKVVTLLASFVYYHHPLNHMQMAGLSVTLSGILVDLVRDPAAAAAKARSVAATGRRVLNSAAGHVGRGYELAQGKGFQFQYRAVRTEEEEEDGGSEGEEWTEQQEPVGEAEAGVGVEEGKGVEMVESSKSYYSLESGVGGDVTKVVEV